MTFCSTFFSFKTISGQTIFIHTFAGYKFLQFASVISVNNTEREGNDDTMKKASFEISHKRK